MMRSGRGLWAGLGLVILTVLLVVSPGRAASVALVLTADQGDNTFVLTAEVSAGDNGGLAGYNIQITEIVTAANLAPRIISGGAPAAGFTLGLADLNGPGSLFAGQDIAVPGSLVFGIGQGTGGSVSAPDLGVNVPWDNPVLLATGTWDGRNVPGFGTEVEVNVFRTAGDTAVDSVGVLTMAVDVVPAPEPGTVVLLGAGGLVLLRRRSRCA